MAYKKAEFITAYLQHEVVIDAKVTEELEVGALCTLSNGSITGAEDLNTATHIIAQSDMTLEQGHVPVENRDYRYSNKVAVSAVDKKVALFKIINKDDVIVHA